MDPESEKKITTVLKSLGDAADDKIPLILLGLRDAVYLLEPRSQQLAEAKTLIYKSDLIAFMVVSIRQDFTKIKEGWLTGAKLATLLSNCCVGLDPGSEKERDTFHGELLRKAAYNHLILSRRIQERAEQMSTIRMKTQIKAVLLEAYKTTIDSLLVLVHGYHHLAKSVFESPYLLKMLLTEEKETCAMVMTFIGQMIKIDRTAFSKVDRKAFHSLFDEFIFKISSTTDAEVAENAIKVLVSIGIRFPYTKEIFSSRYKGLRILLSKWTGKVPGRDLQAMLDILDAGTVQQAELQRFHRAASTIQAIWKGYCKRRQLKKANTAMGTLQRSFRKKKVSDERRKETGRIQSELEHQLLISRRRAVRETHQRQLDLLEIVPAKMVDQFLQQQENQAALAIQSAWRGHDLRSKFDSQKPHLVKMKAALTIQRVVRRFLSRLRARQAGVVPWKGPPGLTEERRVELQDEINDWRERNVPKHKSFAEMKESYERGQEMLARHIILSRAMSKTDQKRKALLATLSTDCELLQGAPALSEATEEDVRTFASRSVPVCDAAKVRHQEAIRRISHPWWKKLDDRDHNDDDDANMDLDLKLRKNAINMSMK